MTTPVVRSDSARVLFALWRPALVVVLIVGALALLSLVQGGM